MAFEQKHEIKRIFKLSDEQYKTLRESYVSKDTVAKMIGLAILETAKKYDEEIDNFWESVAKMVGEDKDYRAFRIEWLIKQIIIYKEEKRKND